MKLLKEVVNKHHGYSFDGASSQVVELELAISEEKLLGIERVDVVAAAAPELVSNDCGEGDVEEGAPMAVAVAEPGLAAVVDGDELSLAAVGTAMPSVPLATSVSVENILPLESTSICWMTETVDTTSVTTTGDGAAAAAASSCACLRLLWKRWC